MDFQLTCRHYELSSELRDYATRKAGRVLKRFDGVHNVEMVLGVDGGKPKAEMIVAVVRGQKCVAEETHEDMFAAIDIVVDKINRQVERLKGKLRERHGQVPERPVAEEE